MDVYGKEMQHVNGNTKASRDAMEKYIKEEGWDKNSSINVNGASRS